MSNQNETPNTKYKEGDWVYLETGSIAKIIGIGTNYQGYVYIVKPHNSNTTLIVNVPKGDKYFRKA